MVEGGEMSYNHWLAKI